MERRSYEIFRTCRRRIDGRLLYDLRNFFTVKTVPYKRIPCMCETGLTHKMSFSSTPDCHYGRNIIHFTSIRNAVLIACMLHCSCRKTAHSPKWRSYNENLLYIVSHCTPCQISVIVLSIIKIIVFCSSLFCLPIKFHFLDIVSN